jgi:4-amino-4-deoxy-L-arabinose transferase-like glycosyltransferase
MLGRKITAVQGLVVALAVLGLLVRLVGIGWGLPYVAYHVDEEGFGRFTIHYFTGDLNPHFFKVPSLYTYLTAGLWSGYYLGGKLAGRFPDRAAFIRTYRQHPSPFILIGRLLTVLLGVGTILVLFALGRRMFSLRVGALAALMLVFSLEHVKQSHYFIPDVTMVLFLVVSFYFIWSIYTTGRARYYLLAGLFAGLAYAAKYSGHFLALPLLLAHFFRASEERTPFFRSLFSPKLLGALLAFAGGFLAGCPYALLDSRKFLKDFRWQAGHMFSEGHFGSSTSEPSWLFYLKYGFRENVGRAAQFLVPSGVIYALARHRKKDILLLSLPVTVFAVMGTMKSYATRYLLPLTPFFILLAALFLDRLMDWAPAALARLRRAAVLRGLLKPLPAVLGIVFLLPSVWQVARYDDSITRTDTRTVAKNWVEANIPRGERIATETYGPPLDPEAYKLIRRNALGTIDLDWLVQRRVKYVIVSDIMYRRFTDAPREFPREASFYRSLDRQAYLLQTFSPRHDEDLVDLHNPTIKVYQLTPAPNSAFPGAFRRYVQSIRVVAGDSGRWAIRTSVEAGAGEPSGELLGRAYIRLARPDGAEVWKAALGEAPLSAGGDFRFETGLTTPPLSGPVLIYIGYESQLPAGLLSGNAAPALNKETLLAGPVAPDALAGRGFEARYFYSRSPGERGDLYFQSAVLTRRASGWRLTATVFGPRLRWGPCFVENPYVRVEDEAGAPLARLVLYPGRLGGLDAPRRGPVTARADFSSRAERFRVYFGYDYFYDRARADEAGGPEEIQVSPASKTP